MDLFAITGPARSLRIFGVTLVGFNAANGRKLILTAVMLLFVWLLARILKSLVRRMVPNRKDARAVFWSTQAINILLAVIFIIGFISIWFDDPARLATALGLATAGLAFALQRLVISIAGYFIILRGSLFNVGDRISMGGVRGDVIQLNFTNTTVMEMGQPPSVQMADPAMWVEARQYTGRVVTVTNDKIFENPVYNYTREFPYIWEELHFMIPYDSDFMKAEQILLDAARNHTVNIAKLSRESLDEFEKYFFLEKASLVPRVYFQLTDNWVEMVLRFISPSVRIRELKDKISREALERFTASGIRIASSTVELVKSPTLRIAVAETKAGEN